MKDIDIAWLAGVLEGDGCFDKQPQAATQGRTSRCRIVLEMTDEDVVQKAHRITGVGRVTQTDYRGKFGRTRVTYRWVVGHREDVAILLERLLPYMGFRRSERIKEILEYFATTPYVNRGRR